LVRDENYEDDAHEDSGRRQEAGIEAERAIQFVEVSRGLDALQLGQGVFAAAAQLGQLGGRLGALPRLRGRRGCPGDASRAMQG